MIWLASFPRSGNTFFRNVLYEVYGLESSTFHMEPNYPVDEGYERYPVVKTHLLPSQLQPADPSIKKVYLVREGRDALVSMAHHRKDIIEPGTDYYVNLLESILAMEGSFFGGWSENVRQWMEVADIVIRFEDLIEDPIREVEKLRSIMDLPEPRPERLPTFEDLKYGTPKYGAGRKVNDDIQVSKLAEKNFRRGKTGSWRDEMPVELERLFWELHGDTMARLGYAMGPVGEAWAAEQRSVQAAKGPYRVLLEGNKATDTHMDGVRRYVEELIFGMSAFQVRQPDKWRFDVLVDGEIIPVLQFVEQMEQRREAERREFGVSGPEQVTLDHRLLAVKAKLQQWMPRYVYDALAPIYRALPIRAVLRRLRGDSLEEKYVKAWKQAGKNHQLVHVPLPQHYFYVHKLSMPMVFTVHDMTHRLYPEYHERDNIRLAEEGMRYIAARGSALLAVSESTRGDLLSAFPALSGKVPVVYEAANADRFFPQKDATRWAVIRERYGIPDKPFLISLSTLEPRKNLRRVLDAFLVVAMEPGMEDLQLLICGRRGWKHDEILHPEHPASDRILFTGHVMDDDLPWLYSYAEALCYVALYEGFGLPPLEAMRCGTPVIFGNNSSLPEIVGDAGLAADAADVASIADCMRRIHAEEGLRSELVSRARAQALRFSWLKTAFQTLVHFETVIRNSQGREASSMDRSDNLETGTR